MLASRVRVGSLPETVPVMIVLGPLIVLQHTYWQRSRGGERTSRQYLEAEPVLF